MSDNGRFSVSIPDDTLKEIKQECLDRGITVKKWFTELLLERRLKKGMAKMATSSFSVESLSPKRREQYDAMIARSKKHSAEQEEDLNFIINGK